MNHAMCKKDLLNYIDEVSFAAYDTLLYLDTHQEDPAALKYFREMMQKRKEAMAEYGRQFGPLTIDCDSATAEDSWQWAAQPWPWEGGKL